MSTADQRVPAFARRFFDPARRLSRIGSGALGGKARGLITAARVLEEQRAPLETAGLAFDVPALAVVTTEVFESFLERNGLRAVVAEEPSDEVIKVAFREATLPAEWLGDLRSLAKDARVPLACRSSSALEDALGRPFAGVYGTKMIPGNQPDADGRFRALIDAVKFVFASTFLQGARAYRRALGQSEAEAMAVVVQEVVGRRHDGRFYPDLSGVARSFSFYPVGPARPEDGVVDLALGLGKTIVDGGLCWSFSPAHPRVGPPVGSVRERLRTTQSEFWAVNVGPPPAYDPMAETEYLTRACLAEAEADGTLRYAASTYDADSDRLVPGTGRPGPRVLDFAPVLLWNELPLVGAVRGLMAACEETLGAPVEIEFAFSLPPGELFRLGVLQVRPLLVSHDAVLVEDAELSAPQAVVASVAALGNGSCELHDVVYVEPAAFEARLTPAIAAEIERLNRPLVEAGRPYLLIGFGRWGSSDPWLGIPVRWDQIAGARAIVEATLPQMNTEPSQGSHFFHNLSSFSVLYFTVSQAAGRGIDWGWLEEQQTVARTDHVRHVRARAPLRVKADGRSRR
ncbi:MAG TPA: PEP/pyruvate-binding domain-containing protein, partial [Vicinamibacteria bacterium]|nr:PEP/pyruvate-binding domain-containing protein [Vicinamibacteria bacterium]